MKKYIPLAVALALAALLLFGITRCENVGRKIKHVKSGVFGLSRVVKLYDCRGQVIKEWKGRFKVETTPAGFAFTNYEGNDVKVAGIVTVEEVE